MGMKSKKGQKPPNWRRPSTFAQKVTKQSVEITEEVVGTMTEKSSCLHCDKYVDLDKLLKTIESSQQIKCGECNQGLHVKGGGSKWSMSGNYGFCFSARKAIWVCLECGYYVCGDVGLPTGSQSHVVRHFELTRHRLVIQCENPQLRWCFLCQSLVSFEKEENGEKKDLLLEVVELIRELSSNTSSAAVETKNLWSGSGGFTGGTREARDGYAVRGLVNLGNTCFFNSVMQNLLSLDQLREHFLKEDMFGGGPLVSSLKELFEYTKSKVSFFRNAINPKGLFFSVCHQAPQFRGYQQHDSHELLRYLLDGLSFEESSIRQKLGDSDSDDDSFTHQKPTLIDSIFGGEISSTVSCMECGHSSKVFEPFLDLSLPIPSKRSPPEKQQTLSPEQKVGNNGGVSKDSEVVSAKPASDHNSTVPILENPSTMTLDDNQVSGIATVSDTEQGEHDSFLEDILGLDTEQGDISDTEQGDIRDTAPSTEAKGFNQTLVGSTETLMHDNDGIAKPETVPDEEDTQSDEDTDASGISSESDDEPRICGYPDLGKSSSSGNLLADEELPLMVADSQILYMPYKDDISYDDNTVAEVKGGASSYVRGHHVHIDETNISCNNGTVQASEGEGSSSNVSSDHEPKIDYVDFSSFFDEPAISEGPVFRLPSKAEVSEAGFVAVSSNDKTVQASEGEGSSSYVNGYHERDINNFRFRSFLDELEISERPFYRPKSQSEAGFMAMSSNEKTVRPGMGEAYSSFMSCDNKQDRDYADFISRMYNVPERPVFGPPSNAKVSEVGFMAVSRDSDPEVVADSDSPVSVDGCLAQFTKPEILSEDNAWHCENCSKNLKLQRLREKREAKVGLSNRWVDENEASSASAIDDCIDVENSSKTGVTELLNCKEEKNAIDDGVLGDSDAKQDPITSYVTETPILSGETISSHPANGNECENWEDKAVDSEEVIVKRAATKRVLVNKAPPVLTIHLKRFSQDARGRLSKLRGHVDFKEYLDLSQYMDNTRWTEEDQPVYRLAGLVEHRGTMRGGHYVAYIRGGHKARRESDIKEPNSSIWYHASDAWVRRVSFEEVLLSEAYILFYERI